MNEKPHIVTAKLSGGDFLAFKEARNSPLGSLFRRGALQCIMIAFACANFEQMWDWWNQTASERVRFRRSVDRFIKKVSHE